MMLYELNQNGNTGYVVGPKFRISIRQFRFESKFAREALGGRPTNWVCSRTVSHFRSSIQKNDPDFWQLNEISCWRDTVLKCPGKSIRNMITAPERCLTLMFCTNSFTVHRPRHPVGSFRFDSHWRLLWSFKTINSYPSRYGRSFSTD